MDVLDGLDEMRLAEDKIDFKRLFDGDGLQIHQILLVIVKFIITKLPKIGTKNAGDIVARTLPKQWVPTEYNPTD
jgi:hypothetical protein